MARKMRRSLPIVLSAFALIPTIAGPLTSPTAKAAEASTAYAAPDIEAQKAALAKLSWMEGQWEGAGWVILPSGQRAEFRQTEDVQFRLGGAILVIEGRGYSWPAADAPETLMFNAFAVVSFDEKARDPAYPYVFRSYAMGYANSFPARIRADGGFEWRIAPPGAPVIRYSMWQPEPGVWIEVGERSADAGATWTQTFEMRLTKKTD